MKKIQRKYFQESGRALRRNGKFIFNSWMIAEIVIKTAQRQFLDNYWRYKMFIQPVNTYFLLHVLKPNRYLLLRMEIQRQKKPLIMFIL